VVHGVRGGRCRSSTLEAAGKRDFQAKLHRDSARDRHHRNIMWSKRLIASPECLAGVPLTTLHHALDPTTFCDYWLTSDILCLTSISCPGVNNWHAMLPPPHNGILASCMLPAGRGRLHLGADQSWIYQGTVDTRDLRSSWKVLARHTD
jgi:hypothetical protein